MLNRVLFYNSGGGIGDSIQLLPLIESIRSEFKDAKFFYLGAHTNHFDSSLKDLNCKIKTLDMGVKYFGFRWWHTLIVKRNIKKQSIESFDLVIDLQSKLRNTLILRLIPHKHFKDGEWNSYRVLANGANIKVWINGTLISDLTHQEKFKSHPKGFIGLQVHGIGKRKGPFEVRWRNLKIKELK